MQLLNIAIVFAVVAVALVVGWNRNRLQEGSYELGTKFGLAHPALGAVVVALAWAFIAAVVVWRLVVIFQADHGSSWIAASIATLISFVAVGVWAYAFSRDYDLPPAIGRLLFGFPLLVALAVVGGFTPSLPLGVQVFCISMVTAFVAAMIPLLVYGWWRGRQEPEMRVVMSNRAMTFLSGKRPRPRKQHRKPEP